MIDSYQLAAAYSVQAAIRDLETAQRLLHYSPNNDEYASSLEDAITVLQTLHDTLSENMVQ